MTFIASARDFEDATAFELLTIDELLSAADVENVPRELDLRSQPYEIGLSAEDDIGEPLRQELIQSLRPLLFGAAWKVIDLMIELGLNRSTGASANKVWPIASKQQEAKNGRGDCPPLSSELDIWRRLANSYAATVEARHCLIHRDFQFSTDGDMTSIVDRNGATQPNVTLLEQEAFCRLSRLTADAVISGQLTARNKAAIVWYLDRLTNHHGMPVLGTGTRPRPVEVVRVNAVQTDATWHVDPKACLGEGNDRL